MTALRAEPPLTQLNAYVELSPHGVVQWVETHAELDVVESSPPGREIELLVTDGVNSTWVQARAICDGASVLAEVIAPVGSAAELPPVRTTAEAGER